MKAELAARTGQSRRTLERDIRSCGARVPGPAGRGRRSHIAQMRDLARRVTEGGARLVTLTDSPSGALGHCVAVETGLPEPLTPFVFTVAGQLLALLMAEALGIDSDGPRGLRKVTETR